MNVEKLKFIRAVLLAGLILICCGTALAQELLTKPEWLPDLSLGFTESYDNNIFWVSGLGLQPQGSWISTISPKIGFNFAPLLGGNAPFQALSLSYAPDFVFFHQAPSQDYDAHKFGAAIKGAVDNFSFSLDDAFLYNDGNKEAPIYALNQLTGPGANQNDKYRDHYAYVAARERLDQIQERETTVLQYDWDRAFVRAADSLLDYNLNSAFHNSSTAPYLGYQNFVDRSDVNGGVDFGYKVTTNVALTLGYRYGSQFQQQFAPSITSDYTNYSSSTYQRVLFGVEGQPWNWLLIKMDGGPDFRDYNPNTPIADLHPTKYYGEASLTATLTTNQNLTFKYKQWEWVGSTGFVPIFESSYDLSYHWKASKRLAFDLDTRIQEYDATGGNDVATGTDPSLRADRLYTISPSATYAFTPQLSACLTYTFNAGNNELYTLPAANQAAYRNFTEQIISLGLLYKF
jgi:hypothetical protein